MSVTEKRELTLTDDEGGSSISLSRNGSTVTIDSMRIYENHNGEKIPLELNAADRRKLIDFLNMGEYRELTYEESR
jgi:hypothetical protein